MGYNYYDTPDGQDCYKKMWCAAKMSGLFGVFGSSIDVLMISHTKGYGPTVARYAYITLPLIGIGTTYAAVTCMATSYRGKDDRLNYLIGGAVAGSLFGVWRKSFYIGTLASIACGIAAVVKKDSMIVGWDFITERKTFGWGDFRTIKHDWSLTEEGPKLWKSAKEQ